MITDSGMNIDEVYKHRIELVLRHQLELMPAEYQKTLLPMEDEVKTFMYALIPLMKSSNSQIGGFGPFPEISPRIGSSLFGIKDPCKRALVDLWVYTAIGAVFGGPAGAATGYALGVYGVLQAPC